MKAYVPIVRIRWPLVFLATIFGGLVVAARIAGFAILTLVMLATVLLCALILLPVYVLSLIRFIFHAEKQP